MFNKSVNDVISELKSSEKGLSVNEAKTRQQKFGANALEGKKAQSLIVKFLLQFADFLVIILLIAAAISIIVDPSEWVDSLVILIVVILNAILGVIQENKAEKSLEALKQLSSPLCKVYRDGKLIQMDTKELVPGDVISIEAGDFIPADARLIEAVNLKIDESALTGESVPVEKHNKVINGEDIAIVDRKNVIFSSTFCTYGRGEAIVFETGMNTEIGKIAKMLGEQETKLTPLQEKLEQIGKTMGILSLAICAVVFAIQWFTGAEVLEAFKTAIALAVAAIPEGLAAVVTVILSIGVGKMVKQNAIVKKLPAVETLGCTSIVCSDKTGTLTQNKMTVVEVYENDKLYTEKDFGKYYSKLISLAAACSDAKVEEINGEIKRIGDPTETALIDANNDFGVSKVGEYTRVAEIPFDSDRKLMTVVVKYKDKLYSITKGAPDVIFDRAYDESEDAVKMNKAMADRALRVLGVCVKEIDEIPKNLDELEHGLHFIGLIGMIDPARPEVKKAIEEAKKAGIRTIMITGDHVLTAAAIAKSLGIIEKGDIALASEDLHQMSDEELARDLEHIRVYARVAPSDKVRIVKAWQAKNAVVAMTGDGVNDSPALKAADIGCAMGITGTDVSKEAAAMILTDDNFATIIGAVKQGRGVYANIKKCVQYLLSGNIGEVITIFVVSLIELIFAVDYGVPLLPIHLLWINLITDTVPAFALGMENADDELMESKPRDKKESFFANGLGRNIVLEGLFIGAITIVSYLIGFKSSAVCGHTMAFTTLALTELFHSFNVKSERSLLGKKTFNNKYLIGSFLLGLFLQMIVLYVPGINGIFELEALNIGHLAISIGLAFSVVILMEIAKLVRRLKKTK